MLKLISSTASLIHLALLVCSSNAILLRDTSTLTAPDLFTDLKTQLEKVTDAQSTAGLASTDLDQKLSALNRIYTDLSNMLKNLSPTQTSLI